MISKQYNFLFHYFYLFLYILFHLFYYCLLFFYFSLLFFFLFSFFFRCLLLLLLLFMFFFFSFSLCYYHVFSLSFNGTCVPRTASSQVEHSIALEVSREKKKKIYVLTTLQLLVFRSISCINEQTRSSDDNSDRDVVNIFFFFLRKKKKSNLINKTTKQASGKNSKCHFIIL